MPTLLSSFLAHFYWIDITVIVSLVAVVYFHILLRSKQIHDAHQVYNIRLTQMRTEIYTEYEKNFFL